MTRLVAAVRRGWRKLVSMRTALVLLFLLAIASVPGSLLPQRPLNPSKVDAYLASHGSWGRLLDRLGFFDVFGTPWFAAIYLLLFVSLIGCLIPRIRVHVRSLRRRPLPAPKHLTRLPEAAEFTTACTPVAAAEQARRALGRRWRTEVREEAGGVTVSAEKGYSRETGNIIFHVALLSALVLIAVGRLYHYEGTRLVIAGNGFCNSATDYDQWRPGRVAASGGITPGRFCVDVKDFTATYLDSGEPTSFASNLSYYTLGADGRDGPTRSDVLRVNHPLRIDGDRLYLISHGYAPVVTVTMPDGTTRQSVAAFIPTDASTLLSEGAFQFLAEPASQAIGLQAIFAPTPVESTPGVFTSVAARADNPVLGVFVWQGDYGVNNGQPGSVYSLDTSRMTKIGAANLRVGQSQTVANGVTVRFDGYRQWVALQVSHDPTQTWLLVAAVAMVAGLIGSLSVRRRRVWVRVSGGDGGPTLVTVGGLARSDSGNFTEEFGAVVEKLRAAAPPPTDRTDELTSVGRP